MVTAAAIQDFLNHYIEPYTEQSLLSSKAVQQLQLVANHLTLEIVLGFPAAGYRARLTEDLTEKLRAAFALATITINISWKINAHAVQAGLKTLTGVQNIIAVASGKGGVGKSTTAVNLALALQAEGARVGLLDADIYGPNQPQMLGSHAKPDSKAANSLEPVLAHGLQTMSIGYLIAQDTPMIWRGPMVTGALQQLLHDTQWQDLNYLIIDLPPGTGDIQLTLAQKIPVSGVVMVTTPQDIALLDVRKGIAMFEKVRVPMLGVIENMSTHICTQCGHQEALFGTGGGAQLAQQYAIELLGQLPLDIAIRQHVDAGNPTVSCTPDSPIAQLYREIARKVAAKLSVQARNYAAKFPNIVIEAN